VFCRHCSHDFSLVKPLLARLISLEKEVEAIRAKRVRRPGEPVPSYPFSAFVAMALCVILTTGYYYLIIDPPPPVDHPDLPKVLVAILPPAILGLVVGVIWNRRWRSYVPPGISLGLLNLVSIWLMIISSGYRFRWFLAFLVFAAGEPLIFVTAALVGSSLRRRWNTLSRRWQRTPGDPDKPDKPDKDDKKLSAALDLMLKAAYLAGSITGTAAIAVKLFGGAQP
jgi:hypothetical protein